MSSTTSPLIVPISNATTTNCHPSATRGSSLLTTMPSAARGPSLSTRAAWPRSRWLGSHGQVALAWVTRPGSCWPRSHDQVALAWVTQPSRAGLGRAAKSHGPRSRGPGSGQSVFFDFWVFDSISFYFGFCSWVFWDFGSLRKEN